MECKNPHCKSKGFVAVIEMDNKRVVGLKCNCCGARYSIDEIEVKKTLKREFWNSVIWKVGLREEKE